MDVDIDVGETFPEEPLKWSFGIPPSPLASSPSCDFPSSLHLRSFANFGHLRRLFSSIKIMASNYPAVPAGTQTLKLNTGAEIPVLGFGTWQSPAGQVEKAVEAALKAGYRHVSGPFASTSPSFSLVSLFIVGEGKIFVLTNGLDLGLLYCQIDCAWMYGNEQEVAVGIKNSGVPRKDIFITTKVW